MNYLCIIYLIIHKFTMKGITKKQLDKRFHKLSPDKKHYTISIPCIQNQHGIGDALTHIILSYSSTYSFGTPNEYTNDKFVGDNRPQTVITDFTNHNNVLLHHEDIDSNCECYEGTVFRRNINLQRLSRKKVFWQTCKIIQDDLFTSMFARPYMLENSIQNVYNPSYFAILPDELIEMIIKYIYSIGLFNTKGIEYPEKSRDYCC